MKRVIFAILLFAVYASFSGCGYNTMQANEENVKAAWGDVEATYQRRMDLIPNLVKTVKAYAAHERETLEAVTEARSKASSVQLTPEALKSRGKNSPWMGYPMTGRVKATLVGGRVVVQA